ncbi:MAG: glycine cleavage system aminomethyltransferase GcvT [Firmicutes bacterium]|nr:glycine cleavage system aminomethyltransferase GcvT [Bacillota bacterium]
MAKRTPLFHEQQQLGAKFTEFSGWELPLYYSKIIDEHMAVRTSSGVFDVSHLGKINVKGAGANDLLQFVTTSDVAKIEIGRGAYTLFCNSIGGIIDDDIAYRLEENEFLIITNASRIQTIMAWLNDNKYDFPPLQIRNLTTKLCLLALQGPKSPDVLRAVFKEDTARYKQYSVRNISALGNKFTVMRSGYTGEEGFEILCDPKAAISAWKALISAGVKPAGLGARDMLRLEMGYPLYDHELTARITPIEAGLLRFVYFDKGEFIGRSALYAQLEKGAEKKLVGFVLDSGIAREGSIITVPSNGEIGKVTSGGFSPILRKGIGMGYVKSDYAEYDMAINIIVRGKSLTGHIAKRPFIEKRSVSAVA